jgi:hypothetical protein
MPRVAHYSVWEPLTPEEAAGARYLPKRVNRRVLSRQYRGKPHKLCARDMQVFYKDSPADSPASKV